MRHRFCEDLKESFGSLYIYVGDVVVGGGVIIRFCVGGVRNVVNIRNIAVATGGLLGRS